MSEREAISPKQRDAVLREAGYRCAVPTCNTTLAIDIHHIVEVSKNGGNELFNLLALCPTCHALYHRGTITHQSIKKWKERLVALNAVVDVKAEIQTSLQEALIRQNKTKETSEQREGFSLSAAEFFFRTCELGFIWESGRRFVKTGYCCFIAPKLALTTIEVVDWAAKISAERGGFPVIRTKRGMAPFTVRERFVVGGLVAIEIGIIDDSYIKQLLEEYGNELGTSFVEPLQTTVRYRTAPFLGERVGILHSPDNSQNRRASCDFQFDSADVCFEVRCDSEQKFLQVALTPILSHVQHRGAPVFTAGGILVGIVIDSILLENERAWRPIVGPAFMIKKLLCDSIKL